VQENTDAIKEASRRLLTDVEKLTMIIRLPDR